MKQYSSIGRDIVYNQMCYVFDKLDGRNFRVEFKADDGFVKFGTRTHLVDRTDMQYVNAIEMLEMIVIHDLSFMKAISKIHWQYTKHLSKAEQRKARSTIFCEYYSDYSFAGQDVYTADMTAQKIACIDIDVYKHRIIDPNIFIHSIPEEYRAQCFGHYVIIPDVVERIRKKDSEFANLREGVVCKYVNRQGNVEMFKIKTYDWLHRLKAFCHNDVVLYEQLI